MRLCMTDCVWGVHSAQLPLPAVHVRLTDPNPLDSCTRTPPQQPQVKDRLLFEQKKIAAVEERRRQQESRKYAKAAKSHKAKEKTEDRKRTLDAVKEWQRRSKAQRWVGGLLGWVGFLVDWVGGCRFCPLACVCW